MSKKSAQNENPKIINNRRNESAIAYNSQQPIAKRRAKQWNRFHLFYEPVKCIYNFCCSMLNAEESFWWTKTLRLYFFSPLIFTLFNSIPSKTHTFANIIFQCNFISSFRFLYLCRIKWGFVSLQFFTSQIIAATFSTNYKNDDDNIGLMYHI